MLTDDLALLDQHCHGVRDADLDRVGFELLMTEGDLPRAPFESMLGVTLRRLCAPVLDLAPHAAAEDYLTRRRELGWREVTRRLLRASGTTTWLVDTGFATAELTGLAEFGELAAGSVREIVRLEAVAEDVAATGVAAGGFADAVERELRARAADAAGLKSVVAYRTGLEVPERRPSPATVACAASRWLSAGGGRLADPDLLGWLVHLGAEIGAELALPLQFHTGFGDPDLHLLGADPARLTGLLKSTRDTGVTVVLLHCWPYHRNAAYLAQVFPHVLVDLGLTIPHVGARAAAVLAETLEIAPWRAVCYSSDGYGLPELHHLGAVVWREQCGRLVDQWIAEGVLTSGDAERLVAGIAASNAARAYRVAA
ncbi:amidohydrolase family protein [Saccharopolyspora taberi]|uniref:Amidohydrolase family protein n=1 Tax=Saccharopolyspora taberi TaxID=60895 RepID=A0ABN3VED0_9PSEU